MLPYSSCLREEPFTNPYWLFLRDDLFNDQYYCPDLDLHKTIQRHGFTNGWMSPLDFFLLVRLKSCLLAPGLISSWSLALYYLSSWDALQNRVAQKQKMPKSVFLKTVIRAAVASQESKAWSEQYYQRWGPNNADQHVMFNERETINCEISCLACQLPSSLYPDFLDPAQQ